MYFTTLALVAAAIPAALVGAQTSTASSAAPTSTSGISDCVLACVTQASSSAGCSGVTDLQCLCTSTTFQTAATACLQTNCSAADLASGQALQQQECASISGASSATGSATGTAVSTLSLSSVASSGVSSVSSAASSALSSISSAVSSRASSLGSVVSSATSAASSAASSSAAGSQTPFGAGILASAAVGIIGITVGTLLV